MVVGVGNGFLNRALIAFLGAAILVSCGGGGGGSGSSSAPSTPTTPTQPSGPSWTPGVYLDASEFKDQCDVPRVGVDIEGNVFPDQQGSLLEENFWLRSWTNETYLWNTEVTDRDPATFSSPTDYFDILKTTEITASGEEKDDFHFHEPTADFLERRNSAASAGYGARFVAFSTTVPRQYFVQYTDPDTPASEIVGGQANFIRGARLLEIDGFDVVNATSQSDIDALNAGLFPATAGETHTFLVQDVGAATPRTVTLVSADITTKPVNRYSTITTPTGKVGYILFNTFSPFASELEIAQAISALQAEGISDLILDLRYNGGGLLAVASQLSYMIAGDGPTSGRAFERLQFNAAAGSVNPVTGATNDPIGFITTGVGFTLASGTPLASLDLPRVFILSTEQTCSASEAVINGLRGIDIEVILIGSTTCGKPYGFYPQDNCGETYYTIQFQGVNDKNFGDYADGFVPLNSSAVFGEKIPGCAVADDYTRELGDEAEGLLAAALNYRSTGTCPAVTSTKVTFSDSAKPSFTASGQPVENAFWENNRDMRMPQDSQ